MEYRKLIKFGNSSHVISLPGSWLKKNKLNKGDLIYFNENSNNELVLTPEIKDIKTEPKDITIETKDKPVSTIKREIIFAYINNYKTIKIIGDLKDKRKDVEDILHNL